MISRRQFKYPVVSFTPTVGTPNLTINNANHKAYKGAVLHIEEGVNTIITFANDLPRGFFCDVFRVSTGAVQIKGDGVNVVRQTGSQSVSGSFLIDVGGTVSVEVPDSIGGVGNLRFSGNVIGALENNLIDGIFPIYNATTRKLKNSSMIENANEIEATKKIKAKNKTIQLGEVATLGASGGEVIMGSIATGVQKHYILPKKEVDKTSGTGSNFTLGRSVGAYSEFTLQPNSGILSDSVAGMVGTNTVAGKCRFFITVGSDDLAVQKITGRFDSAQNGVRMVVRLTDVNGIIVHQTHTDFEYQQNIGYNVPAYAGSPATEFSFIFEEADLFGNKNTTYHVTIESNMGNVVVQGDVSAGEFVPYRRSVLAVVVDDPVVAQSVTITSSDLVMTASDWYTLVEMDSNGGNRTVTLPTALGLLAKGMPIQVVKTDSSANTVTVLPFAGQTINGAANVVLSNQNDSIILMSNGTSSVRVLKELGGGSGTPAGANTQIQFNNSGSFGADSNFIWDNTNKRLGLGVTSPETAFHLIGNTIASTTIRSEMYSSDNSVGNLTFVKGRGTATSPTAILNGDFIMDMRMAGYDSVGLGIGTQVFSRASENWTNSARGSEFFIASSKQGTTGTDTAFRINTVNDVEIYENLRIRSNNKLEIANSNNTNIVSIGTGNEATPSMTFITGGAERMSLRNSSSMIKFNNPVQNKVISLFDSDGYTDDNASSTNFYGFGVNDVVLRYQVDSNAVARHVFFNGVNETFRIMNGIIKMPNVTQNKKLVLWDNTGVDDVNTADTNYYGFGINGATLRYQVAGAASHRFFEGVNERLTIQGDGNVGIGTNAPTFNLCIGDTDTGLDWVSDGVLRIMSNNIETLRTVGGRVSINGAINGTDAFTINNGTECFTTYVCNAGNGLRTWRVGTFNDGIGTGGINFDYIVRDEISGANRLLVEWDTGRVGIGTDAPNDRLEVAGNVRCIESTSSAGQFNSLQRTGYFLRLQSDRNMALYDDSIAIWSTGTQVSDIRYKKDIVNYTGALETINQLDVIKFKYTDDIDDGTAKIHLGMKAQQVEQFFPEMVPTFNEGESNERKLLHYEKLVSLAIAGIKELKAEIEILKGN
jgi:hypothetical protein